VPLSAVSVNCRLLVSTGSEKVTVGAAVTGSQLWPAAGLLLFTVGGRVSGGAVVWNSVSTQ
jgi:hypothetical protein